MDILYSFFKAAKKVSALDNSRHLWSEGSQLQVMKEIRSIDQQRVPDDLSNQSAYSFAALTAVSILFICSIQPYNSLNDAFQKLSFSRLNTPYTYLVLKEW